MPRLVMVLLAGALAFVVACGSQATFATLVEMSSAGVSVNGKPATSGQALGPDDEVKVDGQGAFARVVLPEGVRVFLKPDSAGGPTTFNLGRHVEQGSAKTLLIKLVKGVAYLVVPPRKPGDALEVQASWTTTAVKGTEFKVESGDAGDAVSVKEGTVEVRANEGGGAPTAVKSLAKITYDKNTRLFAAGVYEDAMGDGEAASYGNGKPLRTTIETK